MTSQILVIIPCYNEANRLPVQEFEEFLSNAENAEFKFLFVNDGSKDKTLEVLGGLKNKFNQVEVLNLTENGGKAEAIRQGMLKSVDKGFDYLGYFDADLATPLNELARLKEELEHGETPPYLVMGSRVKLLGSTDIRRKLSRHFIGRIFATVVSNILKLPIYDTQCGAKMIKAHIVADIFKDRFLSKWLFDVELLFRIKNSYSDFKERIIEVPLRKWEDKDGSKISTIYFFKAPIDLFKIFLKYNK